MSQPRGSFNSEAKSSASSRSIIDRETPTGAFAGVSDRLSKQQQRELIEKEVGPDRTPEEAEAPVTGDLIAAACTALLAVFVFGWNNGNVNSPSANIQADIGLSLDKDNVWDPDTWIWSVIVCLFSVGALPGALIVNEFSKDSGRKRAIILTSWVSIVGGLVEASCKWVAKSSGPAAIGVLMTGRFISGFASGGITAVVPVYLGEVAPVHLRGAFGTAFQLVCVASMTIVQIVGLPGVFGSSEGWPWLFAFVAAPSVLQILLGKLMLESPRWLVRQGRKEEAAANLGKLRGAALLGTSSVAAMLDAGIDAPRSHVDAELAEIEQDISLEKKPLSLKEVFTDKKTRFPLTLALVTMAGQQFSGINNAFNYSTTFLSNNGLTTGTCNIVMIVMNVMNLLATVLATFLMDKAGRRTLLLSSAAGMIVFTVSLTVALKASITALCIVSVVSFVGIFGIGMGPIPWLVTAEILPQEALSKGGSVATMVNWGSNCFVALTFGPLSNALSSFSFVPNAVILVMFCAYLGYNMPETKGKTLDQIQQELARKTGGGSEAEQGLVSP